MTFVDLRCDQQAPGRLFARLRQVSRPSIVEGNLIEFACRDCKKMLDAKQVFHRFNFGGELVETQIVKKPRSR